MPFTTSKWSCLSNEKRLIINPIFQCNCFVWFNHPSNQFCVDFVKFILLVTDISANSLSKRLTATCAKFFSLLTKIYFQWGNGIDLCLFAKLSSIFAKCTGKAFNCKTYKNLNQHLFGSLNWNKRFSWLIIWSHHSIILIFINAFIRKFRIIRLI